MNRYVRRYREIQRRSIRSKRGILKMAMIFFALLVILTFYSVWSRSFARRQAKEMESLRTFRRELSADLDRLKKELDVVTSRSSIVGRSSKELGMIFPDHEDLIYVVMDSSSIQTIESR